MQKAKKILGSAERVEAKAPAGSGTKISGYIVSSVAKKCSTCRFYEQEGLCDNRVVMKDPQVKTDEKSGLKIVDGEDGCCSYWIAKKRG